MSGAIPLLPLYVLTAWIGITLPLPFLTCMTDYLKFNFCLHSLGLYFEHLVISLVLPVVLSVFVLPALRGFLHAVTYSNGCIF